jgi:hypothetical protein
LRPAGKGSPIQAAEEADGEEVGKIVEGFRTLKPIGKGAPCKGLPYRVPCILRVACRRYRFVPASDADRTMSFFVPSTIAKSSFCS